MHGWLNLPGMTLPASHTLTCVFLWVLFSILLCFSVLVLCRFLSPSLHLLFFLYPLWWPSRSRPSSSSVSLTTWSSTPSSSHSHFLLALIGHCLQITRRVLRQRKIKKTKETRAWYIIKKVCGCVDSAVCHMYSPVLSVRVFCCVRVPQVSMVQVPHHHVSAGNARPGSRTFQFQANIWLPEEWRNRKHDLKPV